MTGTLRQTGVGMEAVWRAVDNGPAGSSIADQLSYANSLPDSSYGTARDFCDNTPLHPRPGNEENLNDVEVGEVVVTGIAPPGNTAALRQFSGLLGQVGIINTAVSRPFRVFVLDADGNTVAG